MSYIASKISGYNMIPSDPAEIDEIISSTTEMNKIANSLLWLSIIVNDRLWMDKISKSDSALNIVINSDVALYKIITSGIALYYICINNAQGQGLEKLANNILGTTTINWENSERWYTIYNTLNNSEHLFNKEYIEDTSTCSGCTMNRQGDLITLIVEAYTGSSHTLSITPRYTGCYSHSAAKGWSTGRHIMWGGHSSYHSASISNNIWVKHYKFTPRT